MSSVITIKTSKVATSILKMPATTMPATDWHTVHAGEVLTVTSPTRNWGPRWHALFDAMGAYPLVPAGASMLPRLGLAPAQHLATHHMQHTPPASRPRPRPNPAVFDAQADGQPLDADRAAILQFKQLVVAMQDQKADAGIDLVSARQREKGLGSESEGGDEASGRGVDQLQEAQLSEFWSRFPSEPLPLCSQIPSLGDVDDQDLQF